MRSDLSKRRNIWSTNNFAFLKDDNDDDGDSCWEDDDGGAKNDDDATFLTNKQLNVPESFRISCLLLTKEERKTTPVSLRNPKHDLDGKTYSEYIDLAKYFDSEQV